MTLPAFEYVAPGSMEEAIDLRCRYGDDAILMAGGLTVMILLRERLIRPRVVISLSEIPELHAIEVAGDAKVGATVTHSDALRSESLRRHAPLLGHACARVGSPAIRNMGTLGGSVSHGDSASDTAPALLALDARAVLAGPDGTRTVALSDFFQGTLETATGEREILSALRIPVQAEGVRTRFVKYTCTSAEAFAAVTVAISIEIDADGICREARIGLGSVAPMPMRASDAEVLLVGREPTADLIAEAAHAAAQATDPATDGQGSASYRREMTGVWVRRLLEDMLPS